MDALDVPQALVDIFKVVQRANKYIDENAPWALDKAGDKDRLATVMYVLCECLRFASIMLKPFIPSTAEKVYNKLGLGQIPNDFESVKQFGQIQIGATVEKGENIFNRLDVEKELVALEEISKKLAQQKLVASGTPIEKKEEITIDDFAKIQLVTAKVLECVKVEKSNKLLKFQLQVGNEIRQVVSGIAQHYTPESLVGKTVVLVANLKPAKLRGIESQGMILCADADGKVIFVTTEKEVESGKTVR